jgi:4-oxalocrotonate tautomerase
MPFVEVNLATGRTPAQLRTLIERVTYAVAEAVDAPPETVRVLVREVPPELWAAGNETIAERRAASAKEA